MEGGILPWRTEKIEEVYPDIKYFTQPLPHAPGSYQWSQNEDKTWILERKQILDDIGSTSNISEEFISDVPIIVEHLLLPNDTIQGICLKYRVKVTDLRRLNMFSGNNLKSFKTLKIPLTAGVPYSIEFETKDNILQRFLAITNEGVAEADLYLEDHNWILEKALAAWKSDETWQKSNSSSSNDTSSTSYQQRKPPARIDEIAADIESDNISTRRNEFDIESMDNMHRMMISANIPAEAEESLLNKSSARRFIDKFIKLK